MNAQAEMGIKAFKEGRIAEAIVFLEFATKFNPDNHQVWLMLARAYQKDGQALKAAETYKLVLDNTQDMQLTGYAREGLGSIEDPRALAAVRVEATALNCPECGVAIPPSRQERPWCTCGWNNKALSSVSSRLFISDVQGYCRRRSVKVSVMFRGDVIVIGASEVRIQGIGTRTYPVNPRLLFPASSGMLCLDQRDLGPVMAKVNDEALFRERAASADDLTMGKLYTWSQFMARLSEFRGYDVSTRSPDTSLAGLLASYNALDPELINDAQELREPQETLGQTILRLGISNFEAMVTAVVGDFRIAQPGARTFHERLGSLLVAKGCISPVQLQEALGLQPRLRKPLGEILVGHLKACSAADLQGVLKTQRPLNVMLPEADMLGELLVARKKLTRTDMLQALADEQTKRRVPLGEVLINMSLITHQDLQGVLAWQTQKKRLTQMGTPRLGELLIDQKVLTETALAEALRHQVVDQQPLGRILVSRGLCTPEQVLAALDGQIARRNQLAGTEGGEDEAPQPASRRVTTPLKVQTGKLAGPIPTSRKPSKQAPAARSRNRWIAVAIAACALVGAVVLVFFVKPGTAPSPDQTQSRPK
ncbi:tetratricopeptide repeat protein [bacterium]|nr:tetratricopeptide repeat protein [bacterium]